jgi:hypothetical protein
VQTDHFSIGWDSDEWARESHDGVIRPVFIILNKRRRQILQSRAY